MTVFILYNAIINNSSMNSRGLYVLVLHWREVKWLKNHIYEEINVYIIWNNNSYKISLSMNKFCNYYKLLFSTSNWLLVSLESNILFSTTAFVLLPSLLLHNAFTLPWRRIWGKLSFKVVIQSHAWPYYLLRNRN